MDLEKRELTDEELLIYDRDRKIIDVEVKRRLINSQVLISPLNGVNTQLAKNLILCGINISIFDSEKVNEDDIESNFLVGPDQLGKIRGEHGVAQFREMNPLVKIEGYKTFNIRAYHEKYIKQTENAECDVSQQLVASFDIFAISTQDFEELKLWDQLSLHYNKPLYNLLCCGLYGFFYVNLGKEFSFIHQKASTTQVKFVKGKMVKFPPEFDDFQKQTYLGSTLDTSLVVTPSSNDVYKAINTLYKAHNNQIFYDVWDQSEGNKQNLQKILQIANEIDPTIKSSQERTEFFTQFTKFFGIDFIPSYSVIGSVASQEFIQTIGRNTQPAINWFCYDSQAGYGKLEDVKTCYKFTMEDLPELRVKHKED